MRSKGLVRCLLTVLFVSITTISVAGDRFGIGLKAGTYGLGADFGITIIKQVSVRLSFQRANPSLTETFDEVEYEGDFTIGGEGLYADIYPFGGQFRFTAGLFNNRNQSDLAGTPSDPVRIGDNLYTPAEIGTLSGSIEFENTAPYLGVGWGNTSRGKHRLRFILDGGLLFQGSGKVENLSASAGGVAPEDLAQEAAQIEDDIEDFKVWPVLNFGLAIRF